MKGVVSRTSKGKQTITARVGKRCQKGGSNECGKAATTFGNARAAAERCSAEVEEVILSRQPRMAGPSDWWDGGFRVSKDRFILGEIGASTRPHREKGGVGWRSQ